MLSLSKQLNEQELIRLGFSIEGLNKITSSEDWLKTGQENIPAYCDYNFDSKYTPTFGQLFNWYALEFLSRQKIPNVTFPTNQDFEQIQSLWGGSEEAGLALKSTDNWLHPSENNNEFGRGNNKSGANIQPVGMINENAQFLILGDSAFIWSLTQDDWSDLTSLREFLMVPEENIDKNYTNAFSFGLTFYDNSFLDYTTIKTCGLSICLRII
jgi:uncharacterized protein (TIGR02145 family)